MSLVLDASVTLAWYFEDEAAEAADAVLQQVIQEGAVVPPVWRFEVANGLQMAVRGKRASTAFRERAFANLATMRIEIDPDSSDLAWTAAVQLADQHRLTVYDASYLELAQRRRLRLATLDGALVRAADAEQVQVVGS